MVCFLGLTCCKKTNILIAERHLSKSRKPVCFQDIMLHLRVSGYTNTYQLSFRVVTLGTQHKFSDESIKHVLQLVRLVGSVDDVTVVFGIKLGLSAEFTTKKLGRVC